MESYQRSYVRVLDAQPFCPHPLWIAATVHLHAVTAHAVVHGPVMAATEPQTEEAGACALHDEVEPFGIHTTVVNPGFFRTDLISERSMSYAEGSIADYDGRREQQEQWWASQAGKQSGDPAKLAAALVRLCDEDPPPRRFLAGGDAVDLAERKAHTLLAEAAAYRELSTSLSHDGD